MVAALRAAEPKPNARAGKKEGGWGEGIFARPRFPPPPNFVFRFAPLESYFLNCIGNFCLRYLQCKLSNGALRNAPPREKMLPLSLPPIRGQR